MNKNVVKNRLDDHMFMIARTVLALILFPIVTLGVAMTLAEILVGFGIPEAYVAWEIGFGSISGAGVGLAISFWVARRSGPIFSRYLAFIRSKLGEPVTSCIQFGLVGAILLGGGLLAVILLLGHARPLGWDLEGVLPLTALGWVIFSVVGWRIGLIRKRRRENCELL